MRYSGREFTENELQMMRDLIANNPGIMRIELSRVVCQKLNWRKPDGGLKDMRCRVVMLRMHEDKLITLPPPRTKTAPRKKVKLTLKTNPQPIITQPVNLIDPIRLDIVNKETTLLWNEYIERYHYLGYKKLPGAQLRYIAFSGEKIVALLGFAAAAWKTAPRDNFIGWTSEQKQKNLHLIVNNSRFLILPWMQSKNLASKLLSLISKRLPQDWLNKYNYQPVLLETFVEIPRFQGTCYKASNWICVGKTTGRGKWDSKKEYKLPKKTIWLFPLCSSFREYLCAA